MSQRWCTIYITEFSCHSYVHVERKILFLFGDTYSGVCVRTSMSVSISMCYVVHVSVCVCCVVCVCTLT